jgi:hypothetical protein
MKKLTGLSILLLLAACSSRPEKAEEGTLAAFPTLTLPVEKHGMQFLDTLTKKATVGKVTLLFTYKKDADSPIIYSLDTTGTYIDTLFLFSKKPYHGTDSSYDPWVSISKDGIIMCTDTSVYLNSKNAGNLKTGTVEVSRDTMIYSDKFEVDASGKIRIAEKKIRKL